MKRGTCAWLCALLVMALLVAVGLAEDGAETRKPYTVGQVCVTVPVEWGESGHEIFDGSEHYTFEFEEGENLTGEVWIGIVSEEIAEEQRLSPDALVQVLEEEFPGFSIEREMLNGWDTLFFAFATDRGQHAGAVFAVDTGHVVTIGITNAEEARAKALVREIVESAAIVNEE